MKKYIALTYSSDKNEILEGKQANVIVIELLDNLNLDEDLPWKIRRLDLKKC